MKLDKYISLLLQEYDTVIVPGLGAFVSEYKPAGMDKGSGEIKPPSREITFHSNIKTNDGLLVALISEKEGISHFEALSRIGKESEDMLYRLDKGEKIQFGNLGIFFLGENNQIRFVPKPGGDFLTDAFGLESALIDEPAGNESRSEPVPPQSEPESTKEEPAQSFPDTGKIAAEPMPETSTEEVIPSGGNGNKKRRGWIWLLFVFILIIAGAGYYYFFHRNDRSSIPVVEIREEAVKQDSLVVAGDTVPAAENVPADSVESLIVDSVAKRNELFDKADYIEPDTSKYYLVSGSFKINENAEAYLQQMKGEGYDPFHLGKQGNFFIVGIDVFDDEQKAFAAQYDFLKKFPESGVWVYQPE